MSDLISRNKAKEELLSWAIVINKPDLLSREDALTVLDMMSAVDAVPVVRCKDCRKWHDPHECPMFALEAGDYTTADGNGFCDYGERKYDETD